MSERLTLSEMMNGTAIRRGWQGARENRLTESHWTSLQAATSQNINRDLASDLSTLRKRCRQEAQNNGFIAGMKQRHADDVVGPEGPKLQLVASDSGSPEVQSQVSRFIREAEDLWREWSAMPDYTGQWSLADLLRINELSQWDNGEALLIKVASRTSRLPVSMRLVTVHPRRLASPPDKMMNARMTLGVLRDRWGRPLRYFIEDDEEGEFSLSSGLKYTEYTANQVVHDFDPAEPGQARGIPRLAPVLNVIAQFRDFRQATLTAARTAAALGAAVLETQPGAESEAENVQPGTGLDIEQGRMVTLPKGWSLKQMNPSHPGSTYEMFVHDLLSEMGAPVNMPYMIVALDSSGHNYSSARFDAQTYNRGVEARQARIGRRVLNPLAMQVFQEASLSGAIRPMPMSLRMRWVWPKRPHVDPVKEANAQRIQLEDGTLDLAAAAAEHGRDIDDVQAAREAQGLPRGMIMDRKVMAQQQEANDA